MKVLVIAAHPDDEVIGCGGTMVRHAQEGDEVYVLIVSEGASAQYADPKMIAERRKAAEQAGKVMGVKEHFFFDFPDARLHTVPQLDINKAVEKVLDKIKPDIVYTHSGSDISKDHETVYCSTLVACRAHKRNIKKVLCYESLGSTNAGCAARFSPRYYVDISPHFAKKIKAFRCYASEVEPFPHPRSIEALEALAKLRGVECGKKMAEAFEVVRIVEL